jgi:hypothetical protein
VVEVLKEEVVEVFQQYLVGLEQYQVIIQYLIQLLQLEEVLEDNQQIVVIIFNLQENLELAAAVEAEVPVLVEMVVEQETHLL